MAKRGPKPKSVATSTRIAANLDAWAPPPHLTSGAQEAWRHVVSLLSSRGNLSRTDPTLVECYAINVDLLRSAQKAIAKDGSLVKSGSGHAIPHPAAALINSATMRIKAIVNDLGLCPASSKHAAAAPAANSTGTHGETNGEGNKWSGLLGVTG